MERFEEVDVEDVMDGGEVLGEVQAESMGGDLLRNLVRSEAAVVKLLHGSLGLDVLGHKPYLVSLFEFWDIEVAASIGRRLILSLSGGELSADKAVELGDGLSEVMGFG